MGSPAYFVFNNVAIPVEAAVEKGRLDESIGQRILESLINALVVEIGWDDPTEALIEFKDVPFIVQAFGNCNYKLSED